MTGSSDIERNLRLQFEATADRSVRDGQLEATFVAVAGVRQQPGWLVSLRSLPMSTSTRALWRPVPAAAWVAVLIVLLLLVVGTVAVSTGTLRLAPAPLRNGPIVFGRYSDALQDTELYVALQDGSAEHLLLPGANECPMFSPDGRRIAVGFGVVNADGTGFRQFSQPVSGVSLGCSTWSPDGRRLAAEGFNDQDPSVNGIFIVDATDGGHVTRLTTHGEGANDVPGDWSPDGRYLAYIHSAPGKENGWLWIVDTTNGSRRQVVSDLVDYAPTWSPDGQWIVIDRAGTGPGADTFIVVHPDGSGAHDLKPPVAADFVGFPQFSPDGTRLAFQMQRAGDQNPDIYTMKLDGGDLVQVTHTPSANEYFVDWGQSPQ
jgi:Tol biopolymer transport system component